jgi:hypothetical protein
MMNFLAVSLGFERAGAMVVDDDATEERETQRVLNDRLLDFVR